jgi:SAM-dependent methyltransferase
MSDWQERITRETAPAIRAEHELRYRIAAPLIATAAVWADLGCGNGLAAAAALDGSRPANAVLVDVEEAVVARAVQESGIAQAHQIVADLTNPEELREVGDALLGIDGERVVSCFEVIEHLSTFIPLLEWAGALAREGAATFLISVPNDAFWSMQNPHHHTSWGEGAFEELRRLLPAEQTLLRQVALSGSAVVDWSATATRHDISTSIGASGTVATHFIAAFGPRHDELWRGALAVQTDMLEQRRWERQRENDLAVMQQEALTHDAIVEEQRQELAKRTLWFDEWRTYIHELEHELGRPLSGVAPDELPDAEREAGGQSDAEHEAGEQPGPEREAGGRVADAQSRSTPSEPSKPTT